MFDNVNHPKHYKQGTIDPIAFSKDNNLGFHEFNIVKYVTRYDKKNGKEDLEKALFYLKDLIAWKYPEKKGDDYED